MLNPHTLCLKPVNVQKIKADLHHIHTLYSFVLKSSYIAKSICHTVDPPFVNPPFSRHLAKHFTPPAHHDNPRSSIPTIWWNAMTLPRRHLDDWFRTRELGQCHDALTHLLCYTSPPDWVRTLMKIHLLWLSIVHSIVGRNQKKNTQKLT